MTVTDSAQARLTHLARRFRESGEGLRLEDVIGTCRGSTPCLRPVSEPSEGDAVLDCGGVRLFVPPTFQGMLESAVLDYDPSFLGRGLTLKWKHGQGCACHCSR